MKNYTLNLDAEFAGQAKELNNKIPYGYVDKTICGCGLTTLALENSRATIIAAPSKELILNKTIQYPNNRSKNRVFGVVSGVNQKDILNYLESTETPKIMVTYDSLHKLEFLLKKKNPKFDLIIDESDQLLRFANLKTSSKKTSKDLDVITEVFRIAEKYKDRTSFISATPIPLQYMPSFVADLPQIKLNWSGTITVTPYLMERTFPFKALKDELIKPLLDTGELNIKTIKAKKLIIFINSISNIKKIIQDCGINKKDCAVIMGDTLKNDVNLKGVNRLNNPSKLPKFTFISSCGFQGIDLYDSTAINVVVSNTSKEFTMIDVLTDLKQAVSRQRNKNNPNYDKYIFVYNQTIFNKQEEELLLEIEKLEDRLQRVINIHNEQTDSKNREALEESLQNDKDFIQYTIFDNINNKYKLNEVMFNSDKYFVLETRKQYSKGFQLQSKLPNVSNNSFIEFQVEKQKDISYKELVEYYQSHKHHIKDTGDWGQYNNKTEWISTIENCDKLYGKVWKNISYAKSMINNYSKPALQLSALVQNTFKTNCTYSYTEVKDILQKIYDKEKINRKAKPSDLLEFFMAKDKIIKGIKSLEIIKRKPTN